MGSALTLSFAPWYFWPVAPTAFYVLIALNKAMHQNIMGKALLCYLFAFAFFTTSLSWIANSLDISPEQFSWLKPFAVFGIPALLALPYSFVGIILHYCQKKFYYLVVASTWFLIEIIRSAIFPWNLLADTTLASLAFAQLASVIGVYGLTAVVLWLCVLPSSHNLKYVSLGVAVIIGSTTWGMHRLQQHSDTPLATRPQVSLVQPNLLHHMGDIDRQKEWLQVLIALTKSSQNFEHSHYIIWPEAAFPLVMTKDSPWFRTISGILHHNNLLIFGYDRLVSKNPKAAAELYNSIAVIDHRGTVLGSYDKQILVPWGEYIPLATMLQPVLQKVAYGMQDFNVGQRSDLLNLNSLKALPLICYEVIFSHHLRHFPLIQSDFILNITNDSWFGDTIGPYQHFAIARMRAIEYGLPLIRTASSGISAVIDAYGRVIQQTPLNTQYVFSAPIPMKLKENTIYYEYGDAVLIMLALLSIIVTIYTRKIH